jgi:hypothetical protein
MIKTAEELPHNRKWKGQTSYSLENFVSQHRNAYVTLSQCQTHVQYQLPNENTRVTHLLDNIECHDPPLQAAMFHRHHGQERGGTKCCGRRPAIQGLHCICRPIHNKAKASTCTSPSVVGHIHRSSCCDTQRYHGSSAEQVKRERHPSTSL